MKKISRREALCGLGVLSGISLLSGCAVNPVTGKPELMLMSENNEIQMGNEAHGQIQMQYGVYPDESIQQWFSGMGSNMSKISHRKNLPWTFTVLDSPVVNAFAVPGGFIYITRGILAHFNNEAQLAGVLGHEIGHVTARHTAARYSKAQLANLGIALGSIFSEEFAAFSELASLGTSLLFLKFSRDDEREADRLGVEYASRSAYDAVEMSEFFRTLELLAPQGGSLPAWQSTHPDPGDRISATRNQALKFKKSHADMSFAISRDEYLERVDGMIYGDDPRQGYVKDGVFYHPEMKFRFPVPNEWRVANMPTEVRMGSKEGDGLIIFTMAPGNTPREAALAFNNQNQVNVTSISPLQINGREAYKTMGTIAVNDGAANITSHFIAFDNTIFAFHGIADPMRLTAMNRIFTETAMEFRELTDPEYINVSPQKLTIKQAQTSTTMGEALASFGVPEEKREEFAILNGYTADHPVDAGRWLKVVES